MCVCVVICVCVFACTGMGVLVWVCLWMRHVEGGVMRLESGRRVMLTRPLRRYTVAEGHTDRAADALPLSMTIKDSAGNEALAYLSLIHI